MEGQGIRGEGGRTSIQDCRASVSRAMCASLKRITAGER